MVAADTFIRQPGGRMEKEKRQVRKCYTSCLQSVSVIIKFYLLIDRYQRNRQQVRGAGPRPHCTALLGEQVIGTRGLLRNKTRLLVSHGVKCSW